MKLCSNEYFHFLDNIPENIFSTDELIGHIARNLPALAGSIHLGKMILELQAPPNQYNHQAAHHSVTIYDSPNGYSDVPVTDHFVTGEQGAVDISCYPCKDYIWNEEEIQDIHFLIRNIYILCGRARLTGLVRKSAITDVLTGAANTAGLVQYGSMLKAQNRLHNYTSVFLNLKNFKYINQRFGNRTGDTLLRKYSMQVMESLKEDEIFARLGGDNFVVLIHNERIQEFLDVISNVRVHVELAESINTIDILANVGVYPIVQSDTMNEVMNRSTIAVAVAKNSVYKDTIWFDSSMLDKAIHDKEIAASFSSAIANKEFVVYYQPKVKLNDRTLCGSEALVRWQRNGQLVPPADFIPVFEREGTICLIDFYVFEKVCQDIRDWLDKGIEPVRISSNFSKLHLHNKNLAKDILAIMEKYHVDSKYIEIELTESSGYEDFQALSEFINTMNQHGIHTAIDDFGTGYSSLNLLKNLNIQIIKLDKSFLHTSFGKDKSDEVVIKTIINMAQDLGMQVVCEGVETQEQLTVLDKLNCHMAQGFLYDKPLPHDEYEKRLIEHRIYNP